MGIDRIGSGPTPLGPPPDEGPEKAQGEHPSQSEGEGTEDEVSVSLAAEIREGILMATLIARGHTVHEILTEVREMGMSWDEIWEAHGDYLEKVGFTFYSGEIHPPASLDGKSGCLPTIFALTTISAAAFFANYISGSHPSTEARPLCGRVEGEGCPERAKRVEGHPLRSGSRKRGGSAPALRDNLSNVASGARHRALTTPQILPSQVQSADSSRPHIPEEASEQSVR